MNFLTRLISSFRRNTNFYTERSSITQTCTNCRWRVSSCPTRSTEEIDSEECCESLGENEIRLWNWRLSNGGGGVSEREGD